MTQTAVVDSTERATNDEGSPILEVKVDLGGGQLLTLENHAPPGVDAPPLPGDFAAVKSSTGQGTAQAVGYADPKNAGVAEPGEHRSYGRDPDGVPVCEVWLKGDGTIALKALKAGAKIDLHGVLIDQDGNIAAPGEVTAKAGTPGAVKLSTHVHLTGIGPTQAPTPGT